MLFDGFLRCSGASARLCAKFSALLPAGLTEVWKKYGFGPLPGLGGSKRVDGLRRVKIKEHIELIAQSRGIVGV